MWQRFSENAKRAFYYALEETDALGQECVSTEHLALGLLHFDRLHEDDSRAGQIFRHFHINVDQMRETIHGIVAMGNAKGGTDKRLTPRTKRVIDLAYDESRRLNDSAVGTQHLLLGLIREAEGLGGRVLIRAGLELEAVRAAVVTFTSKTDPSLRDVVSENDDRPHGRGSDAGAFRIRSAAGVTVFVRSVDAGYEQTTDVIEPSIGDLGAARPLEHRNMIEVAQNADAFRRLIAIFQAKDTFGYRAMADGEQTMFLLPGEPALKRLAPPPDSEGVQEHGYYVRLLTGEFAGYAGWIFKNTFERTGADESVFPPA